jgi:hypothetical protein
LGRDCENEFTAIVGEDVPTEADMTVERVGFVLSEDADSLELRVDTVRESKVDDAVDSPERYGGFRTVFRERIESLTLAAGEDDRESILNDCARTRSTLFQPVFLSAIILRFLVRRKINSC